MRAYSKAYLDEVVETQGRLFDWFAEHFPDKDTEDFIKAYMAGRTRKNIDEGQAYVSTMSYTELWERFCNKDKYTPKQGEAMRGFLPDWIGEFYAYYQWYYNIPSREVIDKVSIEFLKKAYPALHDMELELAVKKVGEVR